MRTREIISTMAADFKNEDIISKVSTFENNKTTFKIFWLITDYK